jgi:flagellar basal-body rod protein FlgB
MYTQVITHTLALADQAMRDDTQDLANSQTPGFRAQTLSFQQQLAQALRQSPAAAATVTGVTETEPGSLSPDGSSVDLTAVMVNLTQNEDVYDMAAQALQMQEAMDQTTSNPTTS